MADPAYLLLEVLNILELFNFHPKLLCCRDLLKWLTGTGFRNLLFFFCFISLHKAWQPQGNGQRGSCISFYSIFFNVELSVDIERL